MTETPETPDSPSKDDLQSLMGAFNFTPDWAKEEPGVKKSPAPRDDRSSSRGGGPRSPRKSSRRNLQGVRVKPRRDSAPRDAGGRGQNQEWDNRPSRNHAHREPRPPRVPVHVDFIPEKKRLSKVVAVIRQTRRVFPLQVVAAKFMENPAFLAVKYTVKKKREGEEDFELAVCKANGMVFSDRAACEAYILEHGIAEYYESRVQQVDPPTGAFPGIGRHTKSNRLIGPPNWHGYQARMEEVRQEVDPTCPPDIFARQVEMVRDEEVIEAWKAEVSQVVFYRPKPEQKEQAAPEPETPSDPVPPETAPSESASGDAVSKEPDAAEAAATPQAEEPQEPLPEEPQEPQAEPEVSAGSEEEVPSAEDSEQTESDTADTDSEHVESEEPATETPDDRPFDMTREQVEKEFRETVMPKLIKMTQRAIMPGVLVEKMTDPSLLSSTRYHLNRESERPNSIIFALRPAFKHMRLKVYRHDGQLMVSSVEPHPLPADLKVTPEIRQILDYVASNPLCNAKQALEAVAAQSSEVTPDLVSHFRWLIEKGHLIEFHDETLLVPEPRTRKQDES